MVGEFVNLSDTTTFEIKGYNSDFKNKHKEVMSLSLILISFSGLVSSLSANLFKSFKSS